MGRIVHLTTVHPRADIRILVKEARTLAKETDHEVVLVVADGKGDAVDESGVRIVDIGATVGGRAGRLATAWRATGALRRLRPDVVHFHDPELIPVGILAKLRGARVVYDVHEDFPRAVMGRAWIPSPARKVVALVIRAGEAVAARVCDRVAAATPVIAERFPSGRTVLVQNFPILDELRPSEPPLSFVERPPHFTYLGTLSVERGAAVAVQAIERLNRPDARLVLAGTFSPASLENELQDLPGWGRTEFRGLLDRSQVASLLTSTRAGLVTFHPLPNHVDAQPNKMFEYMSAGLPVIASDFPLWRRIVSGEGCGLLVDPLDPTSIAEALQWILAHPEEAEEMGRRGQAAVCSRYRWAEEGSRMLEMYAALGMGTVEEHAISPRLEAGE